MRRGLAHAMLALLLALGSGSLSAKENSDPEHDTLDRYQTAVKNLAAHAKAQLDQIDAETKKLGDRYATEIVGKPFYDESGVAYGGANTVCRQKHVLIAGVDSDDALLRSQTTRVSPTPLARGDFDRWLAQNYTKQIAFARRFVDDTAKSFADRIDEKRHELDAAAEKATSMRLGGEWRRQQYASIMRGLGPDDAMAAIYRAVIQELFGLIWLGESEIGGVTCLVQSELSEAEFAMEKKVADLSAQYTKLRRADRHQDADAAFESFRAANRSCAQGELHARDDAANRLRALRDRFFDERESWRKRMLAWRDEAIAAGPYATTEDVAISRVYDTPAALSAENIAAFRYGTVVPDYDAVVPGSYASKPTDVGRFPAILSRPRLPQNVAIDDSCLYAPKDADKDLADAKTVKYPDLETSGPFVLTIDSTGPRSSDEILPGAEESAGP